MVIDGGIGRTRVRGQSFKLTGFECTMRRHVFPAR